MTHIAETVDGEAVGDVSAPQLDRDQVVLVHLDARRIEREPARTDREGFGGGPLILAGGLTPENVARAIQIAGPHFVDASSGVEDAPGKKSREKIAAFLKAARNAQYTDAKTGAA